MKNYFLFLLLAILLLACNNTKKENIIPTEIKGFHIIGNIESFDDKVIFLQKQNLDKTYNTIQKTTVTDSNFEFKGNNTNTELVYIGFKESDYKLPIILNNFETIVTINTTDLEKSIVHGSELQNSYNKYLKELKKAKNKFVFKTKYIQNNNTSPIAAIILKQMLGKNKWRLTQNKKAYNSLDKSIQNSNLGKFILDFITKNEVLVKEEKIVAEFSLNPDVDNTKATKPTITKEIVKNDKKPKVSILPKRKKAPNFYAESLNGNDISLNEIRKNAKVTLIDFWASWCAPCRKSNPHLVKLYKKYHKSGFNIVSISEDRYSDKNSWKNAIKNDGLIWHNIIDDNNRIANMFNVSGIPHTVLLDQNGGIIFAKKSTYTIEKKLKEIFGY